MSEFKDIVGNTIKLGDVVATNHVHYRDRLFLCTVIGFTAQKIKLLPAQGQHSWGNDATLRTPEQCIVTKKD
jgi:hypothetical protein